MNSKELELQLMTPDASISIAAIHPARVRHYWPQAEVLLAPTFDAQAHGTGLLSDLGDGCAMGNNQLWLAMVDDEAVGAVVSTIANYPRSRVLLALSGGGNDPATWAAPMAATLSAWARDIGAAALSLGSWAASIDGTTPAPATFWLDIGKPPRPLPQGVH